MSADPQNQPAQLPAHRPAHGVHVASSSGPQPGHRCRPNIHQTRDILSAPAASQIFKEIRTSFPRTRAWRSQVASALGCLLLLATPAAAQLPSPTLSDHVVHGDFTGDGLPDVLIFRKGAGTVVLGRNVSDLDFIPIRADRLGFLDPDTVKAADLNQDGQDALLLAGWRDNRIIAIQFDPSGNPAGNPQPLLSGLGPAGADASQLTPGGSLEIITPLLASSRPRFASVDPSGQNLATLEPIASASRTLDFMTTSLRTITPDPQAAWLHHPPNAPASITLTFLQLTEPGTATGTEPYIEVHFNNVILSSVRSAFLEGPATHGHLIASGRGGSRIYIYPISEPILDDRSFDPIEPIDTGFPLGDLQVLSLPDGDQLVLTSADGTFARIVSWAPNQTLTTVQTLTPPAGQAFLQLVPGPGGDLFATFATPESLAAGRLIGSQYGTYQNPGSGYQLDQSGPLPVTPASAGGQHVVLYNADPFGFDPLFEIESFAFPDWTTAASLAGAQIDLQLETFLGVTQGLGQPTSEQLFPSIPLPPSPVPVGNQFEPDSSISYHGDPAADGAAAVLIDPQPGTYANTVTVTFETGPGVTVLASVKGNPWNAVTSPIHLPATATVDYYGDHLSGQVSVIRSAHYEILQPPETDSDGDGVPDAIEELAGLDPFGGPDSDGDGFSDAEELVAGTDPLSSADHPASHLSPTPWVSLEILPVIPNPSDTGTLESVTNVPIRMAGLDGSLLETRLTGPLNGANRALFDLYYKPPRFAVFETPRNYSVEHNGGEAAFGRRISGILSVPQITPPSVPVNLDAPDPLADWVNAYADALMSLEGVSLQADLHHASTVAALAFEGFIGRRLLALSILSDLADRPYLIDEPRAGPRLLLTDSHLDAIEHPSDPALPAHNVAAALARIQSELRTNDTYAPLLDAARAIYNFSALNGPAPDAPPQPLRALRELFEQGTIPDAYAASLAASIAELQALYLQLVQSPAPRPFIDTFGVVILQDDCLLLESGGIQYLLFKPDGTPLRARSAVPLIAGSTASLEGYLLEAPPFCGDQSVEAVSFRILLTPAATFLDTDGDGLDDAWEWLFFGHLDYGSDDDPDGDMFSNEEEYYAGSNPNDGASIPTDPPIMPPVLELFFDPEANNQEGAFTLTWAGPPGSSYQVYWSEDLSTWTPSPEPVIETVPGIYEWTDPDDPDVQRFYQVALLP